MGILDRAIDGQATFTLERDGTKYVVNRLELADAIAYVDSKIDPDTDPDDVKSERGRLLNEYVAESGLVSFEDDDLKDTPESQLALMTNPAFSSEARAISNACLNDDNFKMQRDEAVKKFAALTS